MKGNYTKNMLTAIDEAGKISSYHGVSYVGSEQILYGLLCVGGGVASRLLQAHGVTQEKYSALLRRTFQKNSPIVGFTERCSRMLDRTGEIVARAGYDLADF